MNEYFDSLRTQGFKMTPRRKAIIEFFVEQNRHLTAEDVWTGLNEEFEKWGLPGVYRNLETLVECGILVRVQMFDRKKHYGLCETGNSSHHHHIICIKCGMVKDISACCMTAIENVSGFRVISHFMQVNGICERCMAKKQKSIKQK